MADAAVLAELEARPPLEALDALDADFEKKVEDYFDDLLSTLEAKAGPPRADDDALLEGYGLAPGAPPRAAHAARYRATRVAIVSSVRRALRAGRKEEA